MGRPSLLVLVIGTLVATAAAAADDSRPLTKVKMAYDGFSMTSAPLYYAYRTGIFKKYGLDVTPTFIQGGSTLTHAVVGGSVEMAQNGYTPAAAAAVQGGDIVFIGGISNKLPFQLVVKSSIQSAQQLKGQKIAISKYGSSTDTAAELALAHLGLKRSDANILQVGGEATRVAAAMSGQVAATMEQYPMTAKLEQNGFHVLVDLTGIAGDYPNTAYVTTRAYLKDHPDIVKKFLMVISEGIHGYKTNPDKAIKLTEEFFKSDDFASTQAAYKFYTQKVYPDIPRPSLKGLALVLKQLSETLPRAASMKPEQLIDTTQLDELEREGFFAKLSKQR